VNNEPCGCQIFEVCSKCDPEAHAREVSRRRSESEIQLAATFESFPRIARFSREIVITEKIDGSNGQLHIDDTGTILKVGSRNRWLRGGEDNFGFYAWAMEHRDELLTLGPGRHFGEWFGAGIQRRYGLSEKRFALFNVHRWVDGSKGGTGPGNPPATLPNQDYCPGCCTVVPILYRGPFSELSINQVMLNLKRDGSAAVPGFMQPEGIVIYHTAAKVLFKKTFEHDESGKPE
jgi:hypothetical protein